MRIAVVSNDFQTVTPHAGRSQRFLVFEAEPGQVPREVQRLELPQSHILQSFKGNRPHPLGTVRAVIAGSAGPGVIARLKERGIATAITTEPDPKTAIRLYLAGSLPAASWDDDDLPAPCDD
ncbi:MAG: nitrogen fixation protein [Blastochloris sp.]|nr:nitrogen fixation protein [Blastochloris sp.]